MEKESANKLTLPLAIVAAGALVAGAIYFGGAKSQIPNTKSQTENSEIQVPGVSSQDHILGSNSAELFVVEYSDTECPFCKNFHYTMKSIVGAYGNDVAWVFRHFPIPQLHSKAVKEAEGAECAAELGGNQGFWNYLDEIFKTTPSNNGLDPAELPKIAGRIGLDVTSFNTCLASGRYNAKVTAQMEEAAKAGALGTPYSIILDQNSRVKGVINGAEPIASVKAKLDALLK